MVLARFSNNLLTLTKRESNYISGLTWEDDIEPRC